MQPSGCQTKKKKKSLTNIFAKTYISTVSVINAYKFIYIQCSVLFAVTMAEWQNPYEIFLEHEEARLLDQETERNQIREEERLKAEAEAASNILKLEAEVAKQIAKNEENEARMKLAEEKQNAEFEARIKLAEEKIEAKLLKILAEKLGASQASASVKETSSVTTVLQSLQVEEDQPIVKLCSPKKSCEKTDKTNPLEDLQQLTKAISDHENSEGWNAAVDLASQIFKENLDFFKVNTSKEDPESENVKQQKKETLLRVVENEQAPSKFNGGDDQDLNAQGNNSTVFPLKQKLNQYVNDHCKDPTASQAFKDNQDDDSLESEWNAIVDMFSHIFKEDVSFLKFKSSERTDASENGQKMRAKVLNQLITARETEMNATEPEKPNITLNQPPLPSLIIPAAISVKAVNPRSNSSVAKYFDLSSISSSEKVIDEFVNHLQLVLTKKDLTTLTKSDEKQLATLEKRIGGCAVIPPFANPKFSMQSKPFNAPLAMIKMAEVTDGNTDNLETRQFVFLAAGQPKLQRLSILSQSQSFRGDVSSQEQREASNKIKESTFEYPLVVPEQRIQFLKEQQAKIEGEKQLNPVQTNIPDSFDEEGCKIPVVFCSQKCCYSYAEKPWVSTNLPTKQKDKFLRAEARHNAKVKSLLHKRVIPENVFRSDSVDFQELCKLASIAVNITSYRKYIKGQMPEGFNAKDHYDTTKDLTLYNAESPSVYDHNHEVANKEILNERPVRNQSEVTTLKRNKVETIFKKTLSLRPDGSHFKSHCSKTSTLDSFNHYCDWRNSLTSANTTFSDRISDFPLHQEFTQFCTDSDEISQILTSEAFLLCLNEIENNHQNISEPISDKAVDCVKTNTTSAIAPLESLAMDTYDDDNLFPVRKTITTSEQPLIIEFNDGEDTSTNAIMNTSSSLPRETKDECDLFPVKETATSGMPMNDDDDLFPIPVKNIDKTGTTDKMPNASTPSPAHSIPMDPRQTSVTSPPGSPRRPSPISTKLHSQFAHPELPLLQDIFIERMKLVNFFVSNKRFTQKMEEEFQSSSSFEKRNCKNLRELARKASQHIAIIESNYLKRNLNEKVTYALNSKI